MRIEVIKSLNCKEYLKNHPISYKSIFYPFVGFGITSTVVWFLIWLDINPKFFGEFLLEQVGLKWIWVFASISISFLSVKYVISGPVENYDDKYVKLFGLWSANTALGMSSTYVGIMWGALIPAYFSRNSLPSEFAFTKLFTVSCLALFAVICIYAFYHILTANKNAPKWHYEQANHRFYKFMIAIFAFTFLNGRALDVLRIFRPDWF